MPGELTKTVLEAEYRRYNHRRFVHPDPLEFLFEYEAPADREIVGLVAAGLAYGRVAQILKSVAVALSRIGPPREYVSCASHKEISSDMRYFKHRFTTGAEMAALLTGVQDAIAEHGTLGACFEAGATGREGTIVAALDRFVRRLRRPTRGRCGSLLAAPSDGSACKRMNLYLRWMIRRDAVDPGGWDQSLTPRLIVPLDTHMHRFALGHGLTARKAADLKAALEITAAFARFSPGDPVKYDFALTRPGIRKET